MIKYDSLIDVSIRIANGTFSWLPESTAVLRNIELEVEAGSLTAVVGPVGSGKSSLISACLGNLHKYSGHVIKKVSNILKKYYSSLQCLDC